MKHRWLLPAFVVVAGVSLIAQGPPGPTIGVDLSGEWAPRFHEDQPERIPGPDIGDYLGLPINDAARQHGDAWDASILTLPEHQCKPHPADYSPRGPANLRIWREIDASRGPRPGLLGLLDSCSVHGRALLLPDVAARHVPLGRTHRGG